MSELRSITACPLCGEARTDAHVSPWPNLYSEQIALLLECDEATLLSSVTNVHCTCCGLWYKTRWFAPSVLRALFSTCVPEHPKGWDAVSDRFSEAGFDRAVEDCRRATASGIPTERARCLRSLASIIDSVAGIDADGLRAHLLDAIAAVDIARLEALRPALVGRFAEPVAFKRFSGFSSPALWDWMESHLGPIRSYGEVGCPLWGQLARPSADGVQRQFFRRAENNYWGQGCHREGQHCSQRLAACAGVELQSWPPEEGVALDVLGAFQYLDHLEDPAGFVAEVFCASRALLLILDGVDAPLTIQHFSGWDERAINHLAAMHGKRVAADFHAINASGNRAWLLYE